jgi:hypothetical protein
MMAPTETIEYFLRRAETDRDEARHKYIDALEWLARTLTEAANRAKEQGGYVSETVMSTSLVDDIPRFAIEYRCAGERLKALRELLQAEEDELLSGRDRT